METARARFDRLERQLHRAIDLLMEVYTDFNAAREDLLREDLRTGFGGPSTSLAGGLDVTADLKPTGPVRLSVVPLEDPDPPPKDAA